MFFEDMSLYEYREKEKQKDLYNIGWLENIHDFPKGNVDAEFVDKLWKFSHYAVASTRGFHICDLCKTQIKEVPIIEYKGKTLKVGSAEIRIFGKNMIKYAAPNLLFHYVTKHSYLPPAEFIDAVSNSIDPYSEEYQKLLTKYFSNWELLEDQC